MKREILFRGKAIRNTFSINKDEAEIKIGDWIYGAVIPFDDGIDLIYERDPNNPKICGCHGIEVDHNTVGQFTGLHDKNGKEIYEDDILLNRHNRRYKVSFSDEEQRRILVNLLNADNYLNMYKNCMDDFEVIGNIHEK